MDVNNNRSLCMTEFKNCMKKYRMDLTDKECEIAFIAFDSTDSGEIDYDEFIRRIRVYKILLNYYREK